jgi:probable HAF family extracellular repeat protein
MIEQGGWGFASFGPVWSTFNARKNPMIRFVACSSRSIAGLLTTAAVGVAIHSGGWVLAQSITWTNGAANDVGPFSLSADGSTLVGWRCCNTHGLNSAMSWHPGISATNLGGGTNEITSQANGASNNGALVVGTVSLDFAPPFANRWPSGALPGIPGGNGASVGNGVSADGSVIVGSSNAPGGGSRAFRWTAGTGTVNLGTVPGGTGSSANAISPDGQVIVGDATDPSGTFAFRWTQATGMVSIGTVAGGTSSTATGVSADGSTVVGNATVGGQSRAFRWTSATGMQNLGVFGGATQSYATGVSGDGSIVVGYCTSVGDGGAFIWRQAQGMVQLSSYFLSRGLDIGPNVYLHRCHGISTNGLTFGGYGLVVQNFNRMWAATLPALHCGSADFNCDGDVGTDADIESFFACLAGNCPAAPCPGSADFNHDGDIGTDADIEAFFTVLGGGTC